MTVAVGATLPFSAQAAFWDWKGKNSGTSYFDDTSCWYKSGSTAFADSNHNISTERAHLNLDWDKVITFRENTTLTGGVNNDFRAPLSRIFRDNLSRILVRSPKTLDEKYFPEGSKPSETFPTGRFGLRPDHGNRLHGGGSAAVQPDAETLRGAEGHEKARPSAICGDRRRQAAQTASGKSNSSWPGGFSAGLRGRPVMLRSLSSPISERRFARSGCVLRLSSAQLSRMAFTTHLKRGDARRWRVTNRYATTHSENTFLRRLNVRLLLSNRIL